MVKTPHTKKLSSIGVGPGLCLLKGAAEVSRIFPELPTVHFARRPCAFSTAGVPLGTGELSSQLPCTPK